MLKIKTLLKKIIKANRLETHVSSSDSLLSNKQNEINQERNHLNLKFEPQAENLIILVTLSHRHRVFK